MLTVMQHSCRMSVSFLFWQLVRVYQHWQTTSTLVLVVWTLQEFILTPSVLQLDSIAMGAHTTEIKDLEDWRVKLTISVHSHTSLLQSIAIQKWFLITLWLYNNYNYKSWSIVFCFWNLAEQNWQNDDIFFCFSELIYNSISK